MYLTKIEMPLQNRHTVECIRNCQKMHSLTTGIFACRREEQNILYRINSVPGKIVLYIYSDNQAENIPDYVTVCGQRNISEWVESFSENQRLSFDLITAPTKKVPQESGGNSQRRVLRTCEERIEWLHRKAQQNGFAVEQVDEQEQSHLFGNHRQNAVGKMYIDAYHYQGVLRITDSEKFRRAVRCGIGSGKAYGLGMLLVK